MAEHAQSPQTGVIVEARELTKTYPGARALSGVSFTLERNEIHTLVGQNGAGKSTLVKILCGRVEPTTGSLEVHGEQVDHVHPDFLDAHKIGYVSQEGALDPTSTAFENIWLGHEKQRRGLVSYRKMRRAAMELAERYEFTVDLSAQVLNLSPAHRKTVEILRALSTEPEVLILDEPTAALPAPEVDHLLDLMRSLSQRTSIVFISHYMNEIFGVSDRITVLRDGQDVWTGPAAQTNADALVTEMLGPERRREYDATEAVQAATGARAGSGRRADGPAAAPAVSARGIHAADGTVADADLEVAAGEVVGIFGMVGAGKSELLECLFGMRPATGELEVTGKPVALRRHDPAQGIKLGIGLVPEDRLTKALVADEPASWNLAAAQWRRRRGLFAGLRRLEKQLAAAAAEMITIKGELDQTPCSGLSGGNKQKISLARWLVGDQKPKVLLLDEPTQGLDVGARLQIYELIHELAQDGMAIVVASSDLEEIEKVSTRVYAMRAGKTMELPDDNRTPDRILLAATGSVEEELVEVTHV